MKENGYVRREIVQSREKEAKETEEAEEAGEAEEEGQEEAEEEMEEKKRKKKEKKKTDRKGEEEGRAGRIVSAGWLPAGARIEGTSRGEKETIGGWRMSEDERCRGRKGGLAVVEGTKRGCGRRRHGGRRRRRKEEGEGQGDFATREERKGEGANETVGREGGKTLHEGLEM